MKTTSQNSS